MFENSSPFREPPKSTLELLLGTITGARPAALKPVLYSFLALLFLLVSYYLVKPLRNSQFLKEFHPDLLPLFYLAIPLLSLTLTKFYNFFCDRVDKYRLVSYVYVLVILCKLSFIWILPYGGKAGVIFFYLWASVYFLLALSTLWSCFNDMFTCAQSERSFGFIATGATLGTIIGSQLSGWISRSPIIHDYPLAVSAASMALALLFLKVASRERSQQARSIGKDLPPPRPFWSDFQTLFTTPYVRALAIMVGCLAIFTTSMDFLSQKMIDRQMSKEQYSQSFPDLAEQHFSIVYGLKSIPSEEVESALQEFAKTQRVDATDLTARYRGYQDGLESKTRALFSRINSNQGIVGIILLTVIARFLFPRLGMQVAVLIYPTFAILALVAFAFPLQLFAVEWLLVLSGALNYALNNASKEILYTVTDEDTKFKVKPLIEGPVMRFGDITASLLKLGTLWLAGHLALQPVVGDRVYLMITLLFVIFWWRTIRKTGRAYDRKRKVGEAG